MFFGQFIIYLNLISLYLVRGDLKDPYEKLLRRAFQNYNSYRVYYWNMRNAMPVRIHLSDWVVYRVEEEGHYNPLVNVQVMVTLYWRDIHFRGWNTAAITEQRLYMNSDSLDMEPVIAPQLKVIPVFNQKEVKSWNKMWENLILRRDGTLQMNYYLQMEISLQTPSSVDNPYPQDSHRQYLLLWADFPWSNDYVDSKSQCDRIDLSGKCDIGIQEGNSTDQRWKWSVEYLDYSKDQRGIYLELTLKRNLLYQDEEKIRYIPGMTFDWRKEANLALLSGICILAQYLLPCFVREKFILGIINLILLTMGLMHYDTRPALQLNDICPWITYYSIVFSLQIMALTWFAVRTFLFYNSSILSSLDNIELSYWITLKNVIFKILLVISFIGMNAKSHGETLKKILSLEKKECIRVMSTAGKPNEPSKEVEFTEGGVSSPRQIEEGEARSSSQILNNLSQQIDEQMSLLDTSVGSFLLLCLSLDRVLFFGNSIILAIAHNQYA